MTQGEGVAVGRVLWAVAGAAVSVAVFLYAPDPIEAPLWFFVTPLTVLFGVVAFQLSSIAGTDLYSGSWRVAKVHARALRDMAHRYTLLLYVYFAAISVLLFGVIWGFERLAISLAAGVFVASFGLPFAIARHQVSRLEHEVEKRYEADNEDLPRAS